MERSAPKATFHSQWSELLYETAFHSNELEAGLCKNCGRPMLVRTHGKKRMFCSNSCRTQFYSPHRKKNADDGNERRALTNGGKKGNAMTEESEKEQIEKDDASRRCAMFSDDQRREVASRLRITKTKCESRDYPWLVEDLLQALGFKWYEDGENGIFDYLAALIDRPTCKNLAATKPVGELLCSKCGEHVDIACMVNADDYHARYCPNCGREIEND